MSVAIDIIEVLRQQGVQLMARGDRLVMRGTGPRLPEDLRQAVVAHKADILQILTADPRVDADVAWRVVAMRPQIPQRGPIPLLEARPVPYCAGRCFSCGDELPEVSELMRCPPCIQAARTVIDAIREGVED